MVHVVAFVLQTLEMSLEADEVTGVLYWMLRVNMRCSDCTESPNTRTFLGIRYLNFVDV